MKVNTRYVFLALGGMLLAAVIIGMVSGSVGLPSAQVFRWPLHPIVRLRIMRIIAAAVAGSGLALCGIVLQAILRNPLADPYLLGTSSGAGLGAVIAISLGISGLYLPLASFLGALLSIVVVYLLARHHHTINDQALILAGVIVSIALSSLIVFLVTISPDEALHGMTWWLWGSLRVYNEALLLIVSLIVIAGSCVIFAYAQELNAISIGNEEAQHLGISVDKVKKILLFVAALMTAAIVSICGIIGFVGLMVPHMMRFIVGPNHRVLIPSSCLGASLFMILSDAAARTALTPLEIPIGVITAIIGAPVFIMLMQRDRRV